MLDSAPEARTYYVRMARYYLGLLCTVVRRLFRLFRNAKAVMALGGLIVTDLATWLTTGYAAMPGWITGVAVAVVFVCALLRENYETLRKQRDDCNAATLKLLGFEARRPFLRVCDPRVDVRYAQAPRRSGYIMGSATIDPRGGASAGPSGPAWVPFRCAVVTVHNQPYTTGPGVDAERVLACVTVTDQAGACVGPVKGRWGEIGQPKRSEGTAAFETISLPVGGFSDLTVGLKFDQEAEWFVIDNITLRDNLRRESHKIAAPQATVTIELFASGYAYPPYTFRIDNPGRGAAFSFVATGDE